jgi:hypothetical protein
LITPQSDIDADTTVTVAGNTAVSTLGIGPDLTPPAVVEDPCTVPCTWAVNTSGTLAPADPVNGIEYGWAAPFIEKTDPHLVDTWVFQGNIIAMSSSGQYMSEWGHISTYNTAVNAPLERRKCGSGHACPK